MNWPLLRPESKGIMKKLIAVFALSLAAFGAYASQTQIDTSGLSDAQVAEIKSIAAQKIAEQAKQKAVDEGEALLPKDPGAIATMAATWGTQAATAAEGFAKALAIAAKELNISINDFLASPAGKLTAALIIWKVAGATLVHMLYGFLFIVVGLTISKVLYTRLFTAGYKEVQYSRFFGAFSGTKMVRIPKTFHDLSNDGEWLAFWVLIIITIGTIVVGGCFF